MMVHQGAAAGHSPATWAPAAWTLQGPDAVAPAPRKRKAETQENERLSKRLSLLNLERNGSKLYIPVESPCLASGDSAAPQQAQSPPSLPPPPSEIDDTMQLDDSKHKVYIYNIDDELASSTSSDVDGDDGHLVFLPDIERHLRDRRIPPHILANADGELANMQMVLYSDPRSLTVSEEHDGVRRVILDARHRVREKQRHEREGMALPDMRAISQSPATQSVDTFDDGDAMDMD